MPNYMHGIACTRSTGLEMEQHTPCMGPLKQARGVSIHMEYLQVEVSEML